jgi:hypothetical protein
MIPSEEQHEIEVFVDLYKRRDDIKRELIGLEIAIERCRHSDAYIPEAKYEARGGKYVHVSFRTCKLCGRKAERVQENPNGPLGDWVRLLTAPERREATLAESNALNKGEGRRP